MPIQLPSEHRLEVWNRSYLLSLRLLYTGSGSGPIRYAKGKSLGKWLSQIICCRVLLLTSMGMLSPLAEVSLYNQSTLLLITITNSPVFVYRADWVIPSKGAIGRWFELFQWERRGESGWAKPPCRSSWKRERGERQIQSPNTSCYRNK